MVRVKVARHRRTGGLRECVGTSSFTRCTVAPLARRGRHEIVMATSTTGWRGKGETVTSAPHYQQGDAESGLGEPGMVKQTETNFARGNMVRVRCREGRRCALQLGRRLSCRIAIRVLCAHWIVRNSHSTWFSRRAHIFSTWFSRGAHTHSTWFLRRAYTHST